MPILRYLLDQSPIMATPFSRTIRSLELDSSNNYIYLLLLLIAIVLAIMWGYWFFTAQLLSYEVSRDISITPEESTITQFPQEGVGAIRPQLLQKRTILAKFPTAVIKNIQLGQFAFLRLDGKGKQLGAIPAVVVEIINSPDSDQGIVKLHTLIVTAKPYPFEGNESGEIAIEHNCGVPAHLVLPASGLFTKMPPLSVSP